MPRKKPSRPELPQRRILYIIPGLSDEPVIQFDDPTPEAEASCNQAAQKIVDGLTAERAKAAAEIVEANRRAVEMVSKAHLVSNDHPEWSRPISPTELASVLKRNPKTIVRYLKSGRIRNKPITSKSYFIDLGELPENVRNKYRLRQ